MAEPRISRRAADIEHLTAFTVPPWTPRHLPADSGGGMDALFRQLPHLLACARFVEEHGVIVEKCLATRHGYFAELDMPAVKAALAALRASRHPVPDREEKLRELDAAVEAAEKRRDEFVEQNWGHSRCRGCGCKLTLDSSMQLGVCEDCE